MNTFTHDQASSSLRMRDELNTTVDTALPLNPTRFGEQLIKEKWGMGIDPQAALLVTLDYDYRGSPAQNGVEQGQVASSRTLIQALLANYQTVGDGRFGETAFGLYTPPDVGPVVRIVENVDAGAEQGSGNHKTYEGIYHRTVPQSYGPQTQLGLKPADFKEWVWTLFFKEKYQAYVNQAWPSDEVITAARPYALRTSTKSAFVMTAWLQRQEGCLSQKGLELAMQAAGLAPEQTWDLLTIAQLQAPTRLLSKIEASRLRLYRYTATDIWCYRDRTSQRFLMYVPGNSSPLHEFSDSSQLRRWIVEQGKGEDTRQALASHFADDDRRDGTFHAGVLTALEGMATYPHQHRLAKEAGFFNNDGYWDPDDYIGFDPVPSGTDPFAQLVLTMKQAAQASVETIRDDAQVNRDNLSAVVEPIVQWVNQFGPLALFVPGGDGLMALAGLIDAGYGLDRALNGQTADQRSQGITRTVFGLLNALPLAGGIASVSDEGRALAKTEPVGDEPPAHSAPGISAPAVSELPNLPLPTRVDLLRGVGAPAGTFTDEVLAQIGRVSAVDDDMLRLMQAGRAPTPMLADTIERFKIDQEVTALADVPGARAELFNSRYQALQQSAHEWVRLFQRQYPVLPKAAVEQMLDRYGVDFTAAPDVAQARRLFRHLDGKARQYQQHVRLNRAYEGLYLRSVANPETDALVLHSLKNLPGWPERLRIEVREGSIGGRILDRSGPLDTPDCRVVVRSGSGYVSSASGATTLYEAVTDVLSRDERSALGLIAAEPANELKLKIAGRPLSRSELVLGLGRMDAGLPFEAQGLRGGGFPNTPQEAALTHEMMKLQLREIYPELSGDEADSMLQQFGRDAQASIDRSRQQFQQLHTDLHSWIDQVAEDIDDMDVPFLEIGDPGTQGRTFEEIALRNVDILRETMAYERESRRELADELIAIWQKRAPRHDSHYSGNYAEGFRMSMDNEDFHRLPALNVRFNDVVGLSLRNFHLFERESLNTFLERFPNLQALNLEDTDLRLPDIDGELESVLPPTIPQLQHLKSLNLRATDLTFRENTAAQLSPLVNLQSLDLGDNPLGVPPVVLGMDQLRSLKLNNTGITTCPVGIMDQPHLMVLDLRDNQIRRVPQAVLNQAVARYRVLLQNNPLTDEDTLWRLIAHREQTGINVWLNVPDANALEPAAWLRDIDGEQRDVRMQIWQRLELKPSGARFLVTIGAMSLTPDFMVGYLDLQARVWQLLRAADASGPLWEQLVQIVPRAVGSADNPFVVFTAMEERARLHADWLAMGQPFPIGVNPPL